MRKVFSIPLLWILAACLVSGCAGKKAQQTPAELTAAANAGGPWFCQPAATGQDWECDNDPARVANPVPDRPPLHPQQPLESTALGQAPLASASAGPGAALETLVSTEQPLYLQLAYQPDAPMSLLELPASFFAVQLAAMDSAAALEAFFRDSQLPALTATQIENDGQVQYVLLLGIYENFSLAERAIVDLPEPLTRFDPWIRRMGPLQSAILRAEKMTPGG